MNTVLNCCQKCGHVTRYRGSFPRYECENGKKVDKNGTCDRFQLNISPSEIMRKIDKEIDRLEKMKDGEYQLTKRPPFGQNYRILKREETVENDIG